MTLNLKSLVAAVSAVALVAGSASAAFADKPNKGGKVIVKPSGGHHNHRGRNVGIGLGVAAAAIAIGAAAASANDGGRQCRRWDRLCDDGEGWACRKYRRNCE